MSIRLEKTPCLCLRTSSKYTYLSVVLQIAGLIVASPFESSWTDNGMYSALMVNDLSVVSTIYDKILSILYAEHDSLSYSTKCCLD